MQRARERGALGHILVAAVLLVIAEATSALVDLGSLLGLWAFNVTPTGATLDITPAFIALAITSVLVELVAVIVAWTAFRALSGIDEEFAPLANLTLLLVVALGVLLVVVLPLLNQVRATLECFGHVASGASASGCLSSSLGALLLLLLAGAILALVGYIGLLRGFWRLGVRYDSRGLQIGAILSFFPVLSVAGAVLVAVGAYASRGEIESGL